MIVFVNPREYGARVLGFGQTALGHILLLFHELAGQLIVRPIHGTRTKYGRVRIPWPFVQKQRASEAGHGNV